MNIWKIILAIVGICIFTFLFFQLAIGIISGSIKILLLNLQWLFTKDMNYRYYSTILALVGIVIMVIFILTRLYLGRQVEFHGDFWEHQSLAKSKVFWLNTLFFVMLFLMFVVTFCLFQLILIYPLNATDYDCSAISQKISFAIIAITGIAYLFMEIKMRGNGIDELAKSLDATEITSDTIRKSEANLLAIVEEMAIASNMPMPRVFVMYNEDNINAMCSGEKFGRASEKIAIFVTKGALAKFSREEMQGVIAHEFSHAFHGDITLNIRIFSFIFALTFIMKIAEILLTSNNKSSRSRDDKGGAVALLLIAGSIYIIGLLGVFFASVIQSAVSRQKEFLADASSVQYTRSVSGIKSALKKIKSLEDKNKRLGNKHYEASSLANKNAKPCSHMFFLSAFDSIFATHPSLEKRIEALNKIG